MDSLALSKADLTEVPKPKFRVGEKIQRSWKSPFPYEVLKTPETCIHNNQPSYLLQCLNPTIKTPPFHRDQYTVEKEWHSLDPVVCKFQTQSHVRLKNTNGIYRIVITPDTGRLESTGEPAYSYVSVDGGTVWHRPQTEMEDGRFEPVLLVSGPINH